MQKKLLIVVIAITLVAMGGGGYLFYANKNHTTPVSQAVNIPSKPAEAPKLANTTQASSPETLITDQKPNWPVTLNADQAASYIVIVNKKHQLPQNYVPDDLVYVNGGQMRQKAADALTGMLTAARQQGFVINIVSSYRSFYTQASTYNGYAQSEGGQIADTISAHAGFSEHQTGLAVDVGTSNGSCTLGSCFGTTEEGKWIAKHAYIYGFIVRYPAGKEQITGYQYEPWHLRYLGPDASAAVYFSDKTVDEYFNVPAGDYQ